MPTNTKNAGLKMVLDGYSSLLWKMFSRFVPFSTSLSNFWWFRKKNLLWCWKMAPFLELTVWRGLITV